MKKLTKKVSTQFNALSEKYNVDVFMYKTYSVCIFKKGDNVIFLQRVHKRPSKSVDAIIIDAYNLNRFGIL